jgi:cytoplasmic iron level regulating protein YaaA (DUF328/UPF0246 family)
MLFLLSPSKALDYDTPTPPAVLQRATLPAFTHEAAGLIDLLKPRTPAEIAALMDLSGPLSTLNAARYAAWSTTYDDDNSKPAVLAFDGDVYDGLQVATLAPDDLDWAQQHLAILSGLYGVLRPLDRLQPYRLEMGTRLANPRGKDLYAWWGPRIAEHLRARLAQDPQPVLVNLASQEYFKAVDRKALPATRIVECVFEDWKGSGYKVVSFWAKRARGLMARWAILNRAARVEALREFDGDGYRFDAAASTDDRLVFRRRAQ